MQLGAIGADATVKVGGLEGPHGEFHAQAMRAQSAQPAQYLSASRRSSFVPARSTRSHASAWPQS
jgi:hypothetical protein